MPYAESGDIRFYYEEAGKGEVLVFLHGFTLDRRMWVAQVPFFSGDYRVICPDARGHGLSDAPPTGYGRDDRVDDLRRLADMLELDRFHLVGLSMGGTTAIGFALKHQDRLRSLTLVSTGAAGYDFGQKMSKIDKLARNKGVETARKKWMDWSLRWFGDDQGRIREQLMTMMSEYSGATWMDERRGKYPPMVDLDHVHKITVPTLIMAGALDKMFVPLARQLHGRIADSQLTVFEGAGHMINMEEPAAFSHRLREFLNSVTGS